MMKYIKLDIEAIAPDIKRQIDDEEVQKITLYDEFVLQFIVDKKLVRSLGSNCWECKVISAHLYTSDGELLGSQLFGFDELDKLIGLVEVKSQISELITCPRCGTLTATRQHSAGLGHVFKCKCGTTFIINLD